MNFCLTKPSSLDFVRTVQMLQRGEQDPINIINEREWIRGIHTASGFVIISLSDQGGVSLVGKIITGDTDIEQLKTHLAECLGFDDPLLGKRSIERLCNKVGLSSTCSIAVPGYLKP